MALNFGFIGVNGYVAKRHLYSIKNLKGNLLISYDLQKVSKNVNEFFPNSKYINKFSEFKKKFVIINKLKKINYVVIATPNYTHYKYIKFALSNNCNVICEKPLVISIIQFNRIKKLEKKYKKKVYTILQLRCIREINLLAKKIQKSKKFHFCSVKYISPRKSSYYKTWKGDLKKSGGIIFNIGIHLLDIFCYIFGKYKKIEINKSIKNYVEGSIYFENAISKFILSTRNKDNPNGMNSKSVFRKLKIDKQEINLLISDPQKLHLQTYKEIIENKKFKTEDIENSLILGIKLRDELLHS